MTEKKNYMVSANCYFCLSDNSTLHYKESEWAIVKCKKCGLCYTNPKPTAEKSKTEKKA